MQTMATNPELRDPTQAAQRLSEWTRQRFRLPDDSPVLVSEHASSDPGLPPRRTVVAFWAEDGEPRRFTIFKRTADVVPDDLPPLWMKNALTDGESSCSCC
jgi:hypothetical protein